MKKYRNFPFVRQLFFIDEMLCQCVMVEDGNVVKGAGSHRLSYMADICDLPGLKRHI